MNLVLVFLNNLLDLIHRIYYSLNMFSTLSSKIMGFLRLSNLDFTDDVSRLKFHRNILSSKPVLETLFSEMNLFTHSQVDKYIRTNLSKAVEIGSGVHPFTSKNYKVISSDLAHNAELDLVVDAQNLCIKPGSLDLVVGQFVFHHFSDPVRALSQLNKVLNRGGLLVLIEPANTFLGKILFPIMHKSEYYDPTADWKNGSKGDGGDANQALSYICFNRDRDIFIKKFKEFEILEDSLLIPFGLRYIASGGLNFRQLLPDFLFNSALKYLDTRFNFFAVHWMIILRKI
jgi:SAM-dependent methyltransferase